MAKKNAAPVLTFKAAPVRVRIPATSANLGPAFDAAGLALDLYDEVIAQILDEPTIEIDIAGEGADDLPRDGKHLIAKSMMAAFEAMGEKPKGIAIVSANQIPHGRGLGSSSAAIVGGIALARALVVGGEQILNNEAALKLASEIERKFVENTLAQLDNGDNTDAKWILERTNKKYQKKDHVDVSIASIDDIIRGHGK